MKTKPPKQAGLRYTPSTLALTARRELETHSIIWILQWKLSLAYGSDTQQGAEQSLDHMNNMIKNSPWPQAPTLSKELKSRWFVRNLQYNLIFASGFDTHWGTEKSLDCIKFTLQIHLGRWLWYALGSWTVAWLHDNYNTTSSWQLALTHTGELKSRLIV